MKPRWLAVLILVIATLAMRLLTPKDVNRSVGEPNLKERSFSEAMAAANDESADAFAPSVIDTEETRTLQTNVTSRTISPLQRIEVTLELDQKVLRSRADNIAYEEALQDMMLVREAAGVLSRVREPQSDESLLADQKERMNAALFLTRAIELKNNPQSDAVKAVIAEIVLDDAILRAQDARLKKSIAADRIELFANLKAVDPVAGRSIQERAGNETTQKLLTFANNFYRLEEKKR